MIEHELSMDDAILTVSPIKALTSSDFEDLSREVDPFIEEQGPLAGLIIEAETFPGWADFGSLVSHLRFVRDHHRNINKVAGVTDSGFLAILPLVANHFVNAEVKHFEFADKTVALEWIRQ